MINLDNIVSNNNKAHNEKWSYIPDHPYRKILIVFDDMIADIMTNKKF